MESYEPSEYVHPQLVNPQRGPNVWLLLTFLGLAAIGLWRYYGPGAAPNGGLRFMQSPATSGGPVRARRDSPPKPVAPRGDLEDEERNTVSLFQECSASVAFIKTSAMRADRYSMNATEVPSGAGSGFVWDQDGHIVTNYHVIEKSHRSGGRVRVKLADLSEWDATIIGTAPNKDLAVLQINAPTDKLTPLALGTSRDLQIGQTVYAIGSPFGLDRTLTTGVISGLEREIKARTGRVISGVIQTDAAINPGNSGGPLIDSGRRLIGVNTAIFSPSGAYAGIGFAIPADTVNRYVPQLIKTGKIEQPWFGIDPASPSVLRRFDIAGVLIRRVAPGSTADAAGLRPTYYDENGEFQLGDIIVQVDDQEVEALEDLWAFLDEHEIGDSIVIHILRTDEDGSIRKMKVQAKLKSKTFTN